MDTPRAHPIFRARINERGELVLRDLPRWRAVLARLRGKSVEILLRAEKQRRSKNQNAWYWAAVVPAVQVYLSEATGKTLSRDQTHYILKSAFLGMVETPLGPVPISSRELSIEGFSDYCSKIMAHAATEWGLAIPTPEDLWAA